MCCGSRRSAWRSASTSSQVPSQAPSIIRNGGLAVLGPETSRGDPTSGKGLAFGQLTPVALHCTAQLPLRIWGAVTGRAYEFSDAEAVLPVDPRDAAILTRGYFFRRAVQ